MTTTPRPIVAASLLAADAGRLSSEAARMLAAGVDWLHVDAVDGVFAGTLGIGIGAIAAVRRALPSCFLDVHCAVASPGDWVDRLAATGASRVTFHAGINDSSPGMSDARLVAAIAAAGMRPGIALSPETAPEAADPAIAAGADLVLVMAVPPGFGGAAFDPKALHKIASLRKRHPGLDIAVDGGVNPATAAAAAAVGANVLVSGTFLFSAPDAAGAVWQLRSALGASPPAPPPAPMVMVALTMDALDVGAIAAAAGDPSCGAVALFVGTTRADKNGDPAAGGVVARLEYEAYGPMAERKMAEIGAAMAGRYGLRRVSLHHRLGAVPVGQASVVIAASSPHRPAALAAVAWGVDELKAGVPIWKKEVYELESVDRRLGLGDAGVWKANAEWRGAAGGAPAAGERP